MCSSWGRALPLSPCSTASANWASRSASLKRGPPRAASGTGTAIPGPGWTRTPPSTSSSTRSCGRTLRSRSATPAGRSCAATSSTWKRSGTCATTPRSTSTSTAPSSTRTAGSGWSSAPTGPRSTPTGSSPASASPANATLLPSPGWATFGGTSTTRPSGRNTGSTSRANGWRRSGRAPRGSRSSKKSGIPSRN